MSCDVGYTSDFSEEKTVFKPFLYAFDTRFNCFSSNILFPAICCISGQESVASEYSVSYICNDIKNI